MDIKNFFNLRVLRDLNMLTREAVAAPSLEVFLARLGEASRNPGLGEDVSAIAGRLELDDL